MRLKFESFERLTNTRTPDGRGGFHSAWSVSGTFDGLAVIAESRGAAAKNTAANLADAPQAKPIYSLLTPRAVLLPFHAVVRRVRDGKVLQITGDAADFETPTGSRLDLRAHPAEQYRLPDAASEQEADDDKA